MTTLDDLPGTVPPVPSWGQSTVIATPLLHERFPHPVSEATNEVVIVTGAGGAVAPDLINALILRGHTVIGCDIQLTYVCPGAIYRDLDLTNATAVRDFLHHVIKWAEKHNKTICTIYDLATIQTTPRVERSDERDGIEMGKIYLIDSLCEFMEGDVKFFHMSSAEVYGVPEGAPYTEDSAKEPFNSYGRMKWIEEQVLIRQNGRQTRSGHLYVTALRSWTIVGVVVDENDPNKIIACRNYNDPIVTVGGRLASLALQIPVVDQALLAQFHTGEEVAATCVALGTAPLDSDAWGKAWNCPGEAATHGEIRDIVHSIFDADAVEIGLKWWLLMPIRIILYPGYLPAFLFRVLGSLLEFGGGLLGARGMAGRVPFFYRSTDIDSSAIKMAVLPRDWHESTTIEAITRLAIGLRAGGDDSVLYKRYSEY